ncbi:MAG TPA: FAD-binding oxidoreductase [Pseudomonadales bacterium]
MTDRSARKLPAGNYRTRSGWNALLAERPAVSLEADTSCDLLVVGAGYTGLAAARRWAARRPQDRIVVLDALSLGEGNPGRNSGFLLEVSLAEDADPLALARMRSANGLIRAAMGEIAELVEASGMDCALTRRGTYRAAVGAVGRAALERYRRFLDGAGLPYAVLDREALAARIGSRFYHEGLYSPDCYLAQPAALIRALAATLPDNVALFENSPATRLVKSGRGWRIESGGYAVRSRQVILANNAFAKRLAPGASRVVAMYTYAALTEPLAAAERALLGSDEQWGLLPAHRLGSTLRLTADGRLLVRSAHGYEAEARPEQIEARLRDNLARRFPQLTLPPFASVWSGATGYTLGGGPLWGQLDDGLWISTGCNGGGVVKGTLFGQALAELATGGEPPDIHGLFGAARWLPPEPFRRLGYLVAERWQSQQGASER